VAKTEPPCLWHWTAEVFLAYLGAATPMIWAQHYDPLGNALLSTLVAAVPVVVLLASIAFFRMRIHFAALLGLTVALAIALWVYRMPAATAAPRRFTERRSGFSRSAGSF
jgi:hypothetical protein